VRYMCDVCGGDHYYCVIIIYFLGLHMSRVGLNS
jgi:hypothetical protein